MLDIHSHILYGIDDGSRTKEESIELLRYLEEQGVEKIIVTPHYIENTLYEATISKKQKLIDELSKKTSIKLYIGNEVYFSDKTLELLRQKKLSCLNNSRYLLIELPMSSKIKDLDEMIFDLTISGVVPIVAHPERYIYVQNDIKYLDKLKESGALFQSNYGSLTGTYGKKVEKTIKKLLKNGYISFMGTDIHHIDHKIDIETATKKLKKIVKNEKIIEDITINNIQKVIDNIKLWEGWKFFLFYFTKWIWFVIIIMRIKWVIEMQVTDIKDISINKTKLDKLKDKKEILAISVALASGLAFKDKLFSFYEVIAKELLEIFDSGLLEEMELYKFNDNYIKMQIEEKTIYFNKNNLFLNTYELISVNEFLNQDLIILENKNLPPFLTSFEKEDLFKDLNGDEIRLINRNYNKQELNSNKYILNLSSEDEIRLINVLTKANYFSISIYNYIKSIATGKYLIGSDSKDYRLKYFKNTYDNYILELGIYISNTIERYLKTSNDQWWSFSL